MLSLVVVLRRLTPALSHTLCILMRFTSSHTLQRPGAAERRSCSSRPRGVLSNAPSASQVSDIWDGPHETNIAAVQIT